MNGYTIVGPGPNPERVCVVKPGKNERVGRVEVGLFAEQHYLSRAFTPDDAKKLSAFIWDVATQIENDHA